MKELIETFNKTLKGKKLTIAFAESITSGLLCSSVASVTGASSVLKGGIVTYDEKLKVKLLKVKSETLREFTAESSQTTIEMARGLKELALNADIYVSITGVASQPTNDYRITASVGDVFIAILYNDNEYEMSFKLIGDRNEIREQSVIKTLQSVLDIIS